MSYTLGSAWQRYATADELINIRHFYSIEGVPVPITQVDGSAYGYYKTISDKQNQRNYQTFYNDMRGQTNKYGKKEYRRLKPQYLALQQIISDRFNVISYIPEDRHEQNKSPSQNTKISTRPAGAVKAPRPDVFDPGLEAYEEKLLEEAGGRIEPTIDTSGTAYPTTFFPVIPEAAAEEQQVLSNNTQRILSDIDDGLVLIPDWFGNNIEWVKSGHITEQTFLTAYNQQIDIGNIHLLEQKKSWWVKKPSGIIERINISEESKRKAESIGWIFNKNNIWDDKPEPEDTTITPNMITQHLDHFTIEGQITFTINNNFNSYYYGKDLVNIIQFKTKAGDDILPFVKENRLRFTAAAPDETIQYDESVDGNTIADMESFVWLSTSRPNAFSSVLRSEIKEGKAAEPTKDGFMAMGITGAIALLIGIGLILPDRVRRKK